MTKPKNRAEILAERIVNEQGLDPKFIPALALAIADGVTLAFKQMKVQPVMSMPDNDETL